MKHLEWLRWVGIVLVFLLGVAAVIFSRAVDVSNDALEQVLRYDVAWSGTQGRTEAAELEKRVLQLALSRDRESLDAAVLSHQILLSRIRTWGAGDFARFLDQHPGLLAHFDHIVADAASLGKILHDITADDDATSAIALAGTLRRTVDRLGMGAYARSLAETARVRDELRGKQAIQKALIAFLFLSGVLLLLLMTRQNRGLMRANAANVESAKRLAFLAHHDALTALPNRTAFNAAFEAATAMACDRRTRFAVLAIDLDGFKSINDSLGHAAGDELLISVANRLRNAITGDPRNVVARFGGDEFVVLLHLSAGASAVERANRLRDLLRSPHETGSGPVVVDATIGVAVSGADMRVNLRLPLDADLALTQAKFDGKGTILAFGPEMRRCARRRVRLESDLEAALRASVIQPYYQPQVDLVSGRVVGVEALARWHHADLGWIAPDEFIPVAEASGQINDIGRAILETACRDALLLPPDIPVSVNLSVMQLVGDDSVDKLLHLVERSGLSSRRLTFEVTESTVMKDAGRALAALARVKQHGIRIALDDFGMGYSALSYLRSFAWDELKIDRSFVQAMGHDAHSYSIVETVISLAHKLGIQVIAEGVEDAAQLELLRTAGCKAAQGFLFSRPVASDELGQAFLNCMSASAPRSPQRCRPGRASGRVRPSLGTKAGQHPAQLPASHQR